MKRPHKGQNSSARPPGKRRRPLLLSPEVYITLICEYKQEQERKNPGKKWDGRMPRPYSVDMYNGIRVNVGEWLCGQRLKYAKRIKDNNKEESWTEKRLRSQKKCWTSTIPARFSSCGASCATTRTRSLWATTTSRATSTHDGWRSFAPPSLVS